MMDLVKFLLQEFATFEVEKYTKMAEKKAEEIGNTLRYSIETGIDNAIAKALPKIFSGILMLTGAIFFAYGVSVYLDTITTPGVGFALVGIVAMIIAAITKR